MNTYERTTYSLHTEYRDNLAEMTSSLFDCFTIFEGTGYWNGTKERAARIDIIATEEARDRVEILAMLIRGTNRQESVYVTSAPGQLRDVRSSLLYMPMEDIAV
jgi:hypothetical protein